ncbi:MAG: YihY/virulence factor BrkB family protein [Myxococcota bacterium]
MQPELKSRLVGLADGLRRAASRFGDIEAHRLAAALAFYTLSAIFPLMLVAISIGKLVLGDSPSLQNALVSALDATQSTAVRGLVEDTLSSLAKSRGDNASTWGIVVGVLGSIFAASGIFLELDSDMRKLFKLKPHEDSFWQGLRRTVVDRATALGLVVLTGLLLLCGSVLLGTIELLSAHFPRIARVFPGVSSELASLGFMTIALTLCYRVIPDVQVRWSAALKGGIAAALGLHLARWPLTFAALHLTNYSAYGVLGTLLLLATWFYLAGCVLLFGGSFTAVSNEAAPTSATAPKQASNERSRNYAASTHRPSASRS